ncbi:3-methyl-2-oxobutanoate hydroxymethyltransferase [Larsenimonas salina]|uniref:3-methyl-2-oxobutanoate hydroxymethyltransferase n=1 Tax=Larsenimonas salina TaxID=1295565 RepID=UPI00207310DF|nr:3-methyl-2-oxobutanoate hydroxymethyltransferase [Larsenimonas salina]MCM5705311.1 3-methyl-2-oxobutanoate hydroxymethyltransferase [Larsenimonas salina]
MTPVTLSFLQQCRQDKTPFSCLTAYDATFAAQASDAGIDVLLIGDSLGMVLQGHDSTLAVTMDDVAYHTQNVARARPRSLIMADLPFMANATLESTLLNSARLMQAGANMVKIEGEGWLADSIKALVRRGIPVCAHMGLTPQSVNAFGGYKVQGRTSDAANKLIEDARVLETAGAALILLECVPRQVAADVREAVSVPVIGIGAGPEVDGQILVMHDMLGVSQGKRPRFVKDFLATEASIADAFRAYDQAVKARTFPAKEHCF